MSIGTGLVRPAVSSDHRLIATAGGLAGRLWDSRSGEFLGIRFPHASWTQDICITPDSKRLVTASDDGTAGVWRIPVPTSASVESLLKLSELISGHRVQPGTGLEPLTPEELVDLFESGIADDQLNF